MSKRRQHLQHDQSLKGYYAGFVSRFIAFVIDITILAIVAIILGWTVAIILDFFGLATDPNTFTNTNLTLRDYIANAIGIILVISIPFLTFCLWITYFIGSWVLMGQTVGKQLLGLKVVSIDGTHITLKRGIVRYAGYWISAIPLFAGYWWVLFDDERRSWHDHLSKTCVIYVWDARTGSKLRELLLGVREEQDGQAV